jgi:hypothetical protein
VLSETPYSHPKKCVASLAYKMFKCIFFSPERQHMRSYARKMTNICNTRNIYQECMKIKYSKRMFKNNFLQLKIASSLEWR